MCNRREISNPRGLACLHAPALVRGVITCLEDPRLPQFLAAAVVGEAEEEDPYQRHLGIAVSIPTQNSTAARRPSDDSTG